jgi:hypothetical protein
MYWKAQSSARRTPIMAEITSTEEMAETEWSGDVEPNDVEDFLSATTEPDGGKDIEFFVQMRRHTMHSMEDFIVDAAARMIVGPHKDRELAKQVEAKCIEIINEKATGTLETVTSEIIDKPLIPGFGDKKPVTMREYLGLVGREYLEQRVDREGKPMPADSWNRSAFGTRMQWLVWQAMDKKFKDEIQKATNAMLSEIRTEMMAQHKALVEGEKAKIREALTKLTAPAA